MSDYTLDVLSQFVLSEAEGEQRKTATSSDVMVSKYAKQVLRVGYQTALETVRVGVGNVTSTKGRWLFVSSDQIVRVNFVTVISANDLTTIAGHGVEINANGWALMNLTGGVTSVWVTNRAAVTSTVEVALFATTSV